MHSLTVRLPDHLAEWLEETAKCTGVSQASIIRQQLEKARAGEERPFLRLAGVILGPKNLSTNKGFSKS